MSFIYHIVAKEFEDTGIEGGVLYPLNMLKDRYPESHNTHAQKYETKKNI
jgi:hypothetical protein